MKVDKFSKKNGFLAMTLVCLILAMHSLLDPPLARPSGGRWGWFFGNLWDYLGAYGGFYYWLLLTIIFLSLFFRSKK